MWLKIERLQVRELDDMAKARKENASEAARKAQEGADELLLEKAARSTQQSVTKAKTKKAKAKKGKGPSSSLAEGPGTANPGKLPSSEHTSYSLTTAHSKAMPIWCS